MLSDSRQSVVLVALVLSLVFCVDYINLQYTHVCLSFLSRCLEMFCLFVEESLVN